MAHQCLDRRRHRRAHVSFGQARVAVELRRDRLLDLEGELVDPPAGGELDHRADAQQEVARRLEHRHLPWRGETHRHQLGQRADRPPRASRPHRGRQIAQRTDALLEVWLQQVERVAEAIVARPLLVGQLAHEVVGVAARRDHLARGALEVGDDVDVAGHVAGVEQRGRGRQIVARQLGRRARVAHRVADIEARVPQRIEHAVGQRLGPVELAPGAEDDEVDVAVRADLPPPPPSGGDQGQVPGAAELGCLPLPQPADDPVVGVRQLGTHLDATGPLGEAGHALARGADRRAQVVGELVGGRSDHGLRSRVASPRPSR